MVVVTAALVVMSCRAGGGGSAEQGRTSASAETAAVRETIGNPPPAELDSAARRVIGFLRGQVPFDSIRVADTVTLYVSPEGGGARATMNRAQLRDRSAWTVRGPGGGAISLAAPAGLTKLTTSVGRHVRCMEYPLSSTFPDLARLPHVGTKLEPPDASSCLQTRNLTLVFDPNRQPLTLVAAVYDQWEW